MDEILQNILTIEKELHTRRENDALARYNSGEKVHEKQLAFHKCNSMDTLVMSYLGEYYQTLYELLASYV